VVTAKPEPKPEPKHEHEHAQAKRGVLLEQVADCGAASCDSRPNANIDLGGKAVREKLSVYCSLSNETPALIAKKMGLELAAFITQNVDAGYSLTASARLKANTFLLYDKANKWTEGRIVSDMRYLREQGLYRVWYAGTPKHVMFDKTPEQARQARMQWEAEHQTTEGGGTVMPEIPETTHPTETSAAGAAGEGAGEGAGADASARIPSREISISQLCQSLSRQCKATTHICRECTTTAGAPAAGSFVSTMSTSSSTMSTSPEVKLEAPAPLASSSSGSSESEQPKAARKRKRTRENSAHFNQQDGLVERLQRRFREVQVTHAYDIYTI
jgi:hypothetical protein